VIEVVNFQVRSFDLDHLDLFWQVADTGESPVDNVYRIMKSVDGPVGPYVQIAELIHNVSVFRDPDVHMLHNWRKYFYKIQVYNRSTGATKEFGPEWHRVQPDRHALEIQRREALAFNQFIGTKALIFPAFTTGHRCVQCWEVTERGNTIGRSRQQNCGSCFDTTFVGGFATPIMSFIQIDPSTETIQRTDTKELTIVRSTGRLCCFPPVKARDMIVDAENVRWDVESVTPTTKHKAVIRQELTLHRIPRAHIKYKVPAQLEEPFYDERERIRPMDIQPRPLVM
jgi:hypothetical protein